MGRLKLLLISCIIMIILVTCNHPANIQTNIAPYQIFSIDSTSKLCLYLCDEWGEKCILCLDENGTHYSTFVTMEEKPFIKKIENDTIILEADLFESQGLGASVHRNTPPANLSKLGDYTIVYEYHYDLKGEELSIELGYGTQEYARKIDKAVKRNDSVCFFYQGNSVLSQLQQNIFYLEYGHRAGQFCYFTIDSIKMKKKWHFLLPTEEYHPPTNSNQ